MRTSLISNPWCVATTPQDSTKLWEQVRERACHMFTKRISCGGRAGCNRYNNFRAVALTSAHVSHFPQVDESVMDTSLDMHNRTIRHLLPRYGAYGACSARRACHSVLMPTFGQP